MKEQLRLVLGLMIESSSLDEKDQREMNEWIDGLDVQTHVLLFQLFHESPELVPAFFAITKKKKSFLQDGIGNLDQLQEKTQQLFS